MNVLQKVFYCKQMANALTRPGGRKCILSGQYLCCSHASTSITKILCVTGRRVIKLNKNIISVLVYADTITRVGSKVMQPMMLNDN